MAASERKFAGTFMSLVNARGLQLECANFLHGTLFMLLFCMVVIQWYRGKRGIGLELYRYATSEVCWLL